MERGSGLLVHISELPSRHGIGTFGKEARKFVRFLKESNQKYWQVLPLNPTSYGDSPYQSFSAFALNPYFIDLDYLVKYGYLQKEDVRNIRGGKNPHFVDYGKIYEERFVVLKKAYKEAFKNEEEKITRFYIRNKKWLEDYALFMTIKGLFDNKSWLEWPTKYRLHNRNVIAEVKQTHKDDYCFYIWLQYEADKQYKKLRRYANRKGIKIIGDMPIYVASDSADVWGNHRLFQLNKNRYPSCVAGVPPDCFSETGQLWGNPIYDYEYCKKTNYKWWRMRIKSMSKYYDLLRIDHFRGFESYWQVPANETTAINGKWVKGPGIELFNACKKELSKIQIIAEDLGVITDEVLELKRMTGFPGLKVYQFAFEDYKKHLRGEYGEEYHRYKERLERPYESLYEWKMAHLINPFLPHNYESNCVAYIGTHDNDTMDHYIETHQELTESMRDYLNINDNIYISDTLIGSLMRSSADVVIFLPQDILHLGVESRINTPGQASGNWQYRFVKGQLDHELANHLSIMTNEAGR